jgi:hypothetical protein
VALTLDRDREYTEREIDDRLIFWLTDIARSIDFDHVTLRRMMVDERYLRRDNPGFSYWVAIPEQAEAEFDGRVEDIDVYRSIGMSMKRIQQRKQTHLRSEGRSS